VVEESRAGEGWRSAQGILVAAGGLLVLGLLVTPEPAGWLLWNLVVPVVPGLLALAPGLWRNLCPLATLAMAAGKLGLGRARRPEVPWLHALQLGGVLLLLALVPLRHLGLEESGVASALLLMGLGALAFVVGAAGPGKSTWCASLCPVHPVERLYGVAAAAAPANARCGECSRCHAGCVDLTPRATPLTSRRTRAGLSAGWWMVGGFPGFVWGWFQVPDAATTPGLGEVLHAYALPLGAGLMSLAGFGLLRWRLGKASEPELVRLGAALALGTYYGYRLPALVGMGVFPGQGVLVDLSAVLPEGLPALTRGLALAVAGAWFLPSRRSRAWTRLGREEPAAVALAV